MRNLKRALSLTLASVMLLGMMVVGSSAAAGYSDVDENDNVEAIEVLQAVEVMVGDDRGFGPDRPVTRNEMAVVMGKLLNLNYNYYASSCPFTDVAEWARGWVGACYANGIVSGRGDGIYDGEATVTAVEAASMMMRALGYFKYTEDYADGFQLVTVRQGSEIGIFNGVGTDASTPMTRNQVAQMALNALKANMVAFTGTPGIEVNGVKVGYKAEYTFRSGTDRKYFAISNQGNTTDGTTNQAYIQLGEELYDGDLRLNDGTTDDFGRPARYWEYDGTAIGTYAKKELLREAYTTEVTGKTLYDLLGKDIVNLINGSDYRTSYTLDVTIDGNVNSDPKNFAKSALTRTNTDGVGGTGNGVLTEVYVDNTARTVDIAIINTYLAIAENDYNEKKDEVSLKVYNLDKSASPAKYFKDTDGTKNAETTLKTNAEDLNVAGVKKDDKFLVTVANGELKSLVAPEILTEQTISSHKVDKYVVSDKQYDYATTAQYDVDVMENFGSVDMKEVTYNIVLDKYGYLIGVEQNEEIDQYVFLTGIDNTYSYLSQKNVPVNIIHLDGTMETVTMNTKKSTQFGSGVANSQANTWCTYSVDNDGIYTLTQVASVTNKANKVKVAQKAMDANSTAQGNSDSEIKINSKNISLNGDGTVIGKVHGNDSTVYINVDMVNVKVDSSNYRRIVDDVDSVVTGVTNVDLTVKDIGTGAIGSKVVAEKGQNYTVADNEVYTLYKDNGTIIAVVTLEALDNATTKHYAYISSSNIDHRDYDATAKEYSWYREAIVDGEFVMLKEVDDSSSSTYVHNGTGGLARGQWYEIKYNADGEVRGTEAVTYAAAQGTAPAGTMPEIGTKWMQDSNMVANAIDKTFILQADYTTAPYNTELKYVGGTLYTGNDTTKGVYVAPTAKVVVFTKNYDKHEEFTGAEMEKALAALNDKEHFNGYVNAVIGSNGVATVVIIDEKTAGSSGNNTYTVSVDGDTTNMSYTITDGTTTVNNTSLTVAKGANVTVTFTADAGYVFTENSKTTLKRTFTSVTAAKTVIAPEIEEGVEKIKLDVKLGTGVALLDVNSAPYGNGKAIVGEKGDVLVIVAKDPSNTTLTTGVAAYFQSKDSTDNIQLNQNASSQYIVTLTENGTLYVTADADEIAQLYFEDAKERIESRTFDLYYKVEDDASLMRGAGIQYFQDATGHRHGEIWSNVEACVAITGNGYTWFQKSNLIQEAIYSYLTSLAATEGQGYDLVKGSGSAIYVQASDVGIGTYTAAGMENFGAGQVNKYELKGGSLVGPTKVGETKDGKPIYQFTSVVIVREATGNTEIGRVNVKFNLREVEGKPVDWIAPETPNVTGVTGTGDATAKTVTLTKGSGNWAAGVYRLYNENGTSIVGSGTINSNAVGVAAVVADGTSSTLTFSLTDTPATGKFKIAYYGDEVGIRDASALSAAIDVTVS